MNRLSGTCFVKDTVPYLYPKRRGSRTGYTFICIWTIASILTGAMIETNAKLTGFTMVFRSFDIVMLILSTLLLERAFAYENPYLVIPWIATSAWNMYRCQYQSLFKILRGINRVKMASKLMWLTFSLDVLTFGTKILLLVRVAHLGINMWYQNKLEKETLRNNPN